MSLSYIFMIFTGESIAVTFFATAVSFAGLSLYGYTTKKDLSGFSGGMKQRFGIAQALIGNPRLIIVDEPTAGLDPGERNRFYNLLAEIGEDRIVILSTHIVEDVRELCTNMAIIHKGEVRYAQSDGELTATLSELSRAGRRWKDPQRYKGLGEMDAGQLRETTMEPGKRTLRRVRVEDAHDAAKVFDLLMGSDVAPRKEFIVAGSAGLDRDRIDA